MATVSKEQALQERLDKRAGLVSAVLRKFITNFYKARQDLLDESRAKELAKLARKGKKGKKKKAAQSKDEPKPPAGKGKKKSNPLQDAWLAFLADMDERINKQKRVGLEDIYRGTEQLDAQERTALAALLATTNKKILPITMLNINQQNVRMALMSASAALAEPAPVPMRSCPGLRTLQQRAASVEELLETGYSVEDALRSGYSVYEAVEAGKLNLKGLREAGIRLQDILDCPTVPGLRQELQEGPKGIKLLKQAGYCASELVACGGNLANPWNLSHGGYSLTELYNVGFSPAELRAAGFGDPGLQPASGPMGQSCKIQAEIPETVGLPMMGTKTPFWKEQLQRQSAHSQGGATQPQNVASGSSIDAGRQGLATGGRTDAGTPREFKQSFSMMIGKA